MNEIVISASGKRKVTFPILISLFWQTPAVFATYIPETVSKERGSEETNRVRGIAEAAVAAVTTIKGGTNANDDKTTIIIAVSSSLSVLALVLAALFFRSYMKKRLKKLQVLQSLKRNLSSSSFIFHLNQIGRRLKSSRKSQPRRLPSNWIQTLRRSKCTGRKRPKRPRMKRPRRIIWSE
jgi:hypothetical protein